MPNEKDIPRPSKYSRVVTPTIIQIEYIECGAVALGIILGYYGKFVKIEMLRSLCGVSRGGSSALNICEAAEFLDMEAEGHKLELEELYQAPLPLIAHWNFDHFVVIEGFSRKEVYINDPATGPRTISYKELDESFTGVCLVLKPKSGFRQAKPYKTTLRILYEQAQIFKYPLLFIFGISACLVIPQLLLAALSQVFIDTILMQNNFSWINWFYFSIVLLAIFTTGMHVLMSRVTLRLNIKMAIYFSSRFLHHILRLPYEFFLNRYSGEIVTRVGLNENVANNISNTFLTMVLDVLLAFVYGIVIFFYDPIIASAGMLTAFIDLFILRYVYNSRKNSYAYLRQVIGKSYGYTMSTLAGIETIKAGAMENKNFSTWSGYYTRTINANQTISQQDIVATVYPGFFAALSNILIITLGAWRVINGYLTVGMLVALRILMTQFTAPISRLVSSIQQIQLTKIDMDRLNDVTTHPLDETFSRDIYEPESVRHLPYAKLKGNVELNEISYAYSLFGEDVLKGLNLKILPGTMVGVIGPSGCGKSTLLKVLAGLLLPTGGQLLYDGVPQPALSRKLLTNSIAIVEQETHFFPGTIKDNLTLYKHHFDQESIERAAKDACIHNEILLRKEKYNLELQSNAGNLSGGERQRLAIARALLQKPSILLLDEATSAVDAEEELQLMKNIKRLMCTCILTAQRLSSIRYCELLIVLYQGKIIQMGPPDKLAAAPGLFKELLKAEQI